jgi:hypothetical protein
MGAFSVHFSTNINGNVRKYPHKLKGQSPDGVDTKRTVTGVDRGAVTALRSGQHGSAGPIVMTKQVATALASELKDGARISAYEKPAYFAAVAAANGDDVRVTDGTGHWRKFTATSAGAKAFFDGVRGVRVQRN